MPSFRAPRADLPLYCSESQQYPIRTLCRVLGVSVSGYYEWRGRKLSQHSREDGELATQIHRLFFANRGVYGSPRIHAELRAHGIRCSKERTARLMREMELVAKQKRSTPIGTKRRRGAMIAANLLERNFTADPPHYQMGERYNVRLDGRRLA